MGFATVCLSTGVRQPQAIALYESSGYALTEPYGKYVGQPLTRCYRKTLLPERTVMSAGEAAEPTEFPHGIGKVARRELALNGYTTYEQLTRVTAAELLRIHGVGPKAIRILGEELAARGLGFATG